MEAPGGSPERIELPARFDDRLAPRPTSYRLATTVALPESLRRRPLSLSIPYFLGSTRLAVDGAEARPASVEAAAARSAGHHVFLIPADATSGPTLDLTLVVQHRLANSAWFDTVPRLSDAPLGDATTLTVRRINRTVGWLAMGMLLTMGCTYLGLALMDRSHPVNVANAARSLLAVSYPAFVLGIMRDLSPRAEFLTFVSCLVLCSILIVAISTSFGLPSHKRTWTGIFAAFLLVCAAVNDPFRAPSVLGGLTVALLTVVFLFELRRLLTLLRRTPRPPTLWPNLVGTVVLILTASVDGAPWIGLGEPLNGLRIGTGGLSAYALLQFVALSLDVVRNQKQTAQLNADLQRNLEFAEQQRVEIETLNVELKRQVAERSKQLGDALGRLAVAQGETRALQPGDTVNARYRILGDLGAGAMGSVYRCKRVADDKTLALKALTHNHDARFLARFAREAQLASGIHAEHIVNIYDVDIAEAGFMFIVMELVEGESLKENAQRYGDLDWALPVLAQVARGLASIHAHGVVHRDLKPANVLAAPGEGGAAPRVKITDFGISGLSDTMSDPGVARRPSISDLAAAHAATDPNLATMTGASLSPGLALAPPRSGASKPAGKGKRGTTTGDNLTQAGMVLGTPAYMAPELARGAQHASAASDVFALGVLAFELIAKVRPFEPPVASAIMHELPIPAADELADYRADVPDAIRDAIERCLSMSPADRPSAADVAAAIETELAGPATAAAR